MSSLTSAKLLWSADPRLVAWYQDVIAWFNTDFPGCELLVIQSYRTPSQQQQAAAGGKSAYDGKTTFSMHQAFPALALDLAVYDSHGNYVTDGTDPRYAWLGQHVDPDTMRWGGNFSNPDWDHVELTVTPAPDATAVAVGFVRYQTTCRVSEYLT